MKNIIYKITWRLRWLYKSFWALVWAAIREPTKQPWEYILDNATRSAHVRYNKSFHYLKKYFSVSEQEEVYRLALAPNNFSIDKIFLNSPEKVWAFLIQYFDIVYTSTVRYPIAGIMPEGPYEQAGVTLQPGDTVIDAGANFGMFSFFAAQKVGTSGQVFAFEPVDTIADNLLRSKGLNSQGQQVELVRLALGDQENDLDFYFSSEDYGGSSKTPGQKDHIKVSQTTLDAFVSSRRLEKVSFIKMDIEGMEPEALRGATETIKRFKPKLAICIYHFPEEKKQVTDIVRSLRTDYHIVYSEAKLFAW